MNIRRVISVGAALLLVVAAFLGTSCKAAPTPTPKPTSTVAATPTPTPAAPFRLGIIYPQTGAFAQYFQETMAGHQIAADEINAAGGILGRRIEFVIADDKSDPQEGARVARDMIVRNGIRHIIGQFSSAVAESVATVAKEEGILYTHDGAATSKPAEEGFFPTIWHWQTNTTSLGVSLVMPAVESGAKRFFFISPDYAMGHGNKDAAWAYIQKKVPGAVQVGEMWPKLGETDFSSVISAVMAKKSEIDAVVMYLGGGDNANFMKQAVPFGFYKELKVYTYLLGDALPMKPLGKTVPEGVWGNVPSYVPWLLDETPMGKRFYAEFKKRIGHPAPSYMAPAAYDETYALKYAIEKAKSFEPKDIAKAMENMTGDYILGKVTIREIDHQAMVPVVVGRTVWDEQLGYMAIKGDTKVLWPDKYPDLYHSPDEIKKLRGG